MLQTLLQKYSNSFSLETNTPALSIEYDAQSRLYRVVTPRGSVQCRKVVHCTNGHAGHLLPGLVGAVYPIRGTMSAQRPGQTFPLLGDKISWSYFARPWFDTRSLVYNTGLTYAQQHKSSQKLFIGAGCDRIDDMLSSDDSKLTQVAQDNIYTSASKLLSNVEPVTDRAAWSGIMGFTSDGFPLAGQLWQDITGRDGRGEWIAAGFNGHGMDKCWLTGEAVAALVLGKEPAGLPSVFRLSPKRFEVLGAETSASGFLEELSSWSV